MKKIFSPLFCLLLVSSCTPAGSPQPSAMNSTSTTPPVAQTQQANKSLQKNAESKKKYVPAKKAAVPSKMNSSKTDSSATERERHEETVKEIETLVS